MGLGDLLSFSDEMSLEVSRMLKIVETKKENGE
jgi:hypothetical protein